MEPVVFDDFLLRVIRAYNDHGDFLHVVCTTTSGTVSICRATWPDTPFKAVFRAAYGFTYYSIMFDTNHGGRSVLSGAFVGNFIAMNVDHVI